MGGKQILEDFTGWATLIFGIVIFGGILLFSFFTWGFLAGFNFLKVFLYLLIAVIILYLIFKKKKHKIQSGGGNLFSLKTFIQYGITFSLAYWLSTLLLPYIKTDNLFIIFLFTGLILELSSKVSRMISKNRGYITIDKHFILWVVIHSIVVYGVLYAFSYITINNKIIYFIGVGFGIALVTHVIWRLMFK